MIIAFAVFWLSVAAVLLFFLETVFKMLSVMLETLTIYAAYIIVGGILIILGFLALFGLYHFGHQVALNGFYDTVIDGFGNLIFYVIVIGGVLVFLFYLGALVLGVITTVLVTVLEGLDGLMQRLALLFEKGYFGCIVGIHKCLGKE